MRNHGVVSSETRSSDPCSPGDQVAMDQLIEKKHDNPVSEFWRSKYEKEARRHWDLFYKRNTTNFFKNRYYIENEFDLLRDTNRDLRILEAGCGVGNTIFPLLERNPHLFLYGVDFSPRAIEMVQQHPLYSHEMCEAHVADLTSGSLPSAILPLDGCIFLFALSAIAPGPPMEAALAALLQRLKPEGELFFRDYARYDMAQLRFAASAVLDRDYYVRCDGTRSFFFTLEDTRDLFEKVGFRTKTIEYHRVVVHNRKQDSTMRRVWLQGIFTRP